MDDVLLNKAAIIERCLRRIESLYRGHEDELATNFDRQDAIVLNLQRACEAAIDGALHQIRKGHLGLPQSRRDAFALLVQAGLLDPALGQVMQRMVGFRNVVVHAYQELNPAILRAVLERHLDDLRRFARLLIHWAQEED